MDPNYISGRWPKLRLLPQMAKVSYQWVFYLYAVMILLELFLESFCLSDLLHSNLKMHSIVTETFGIFSFKGSPSGGFIQNKVSPEWPLQFQSIQKFTQFSERHKNLIQGLDGTYLAFGFFKRYHEWPRFPTAVLKHWESHVFLFWTGWETYQEASTSRNKQKGVNRNRDQVCTVKLESWEHKQNK